MDVGTLGHSHDNYSQDVTIAAPTVGTLAQPSDYHLGETTATYSADGTLGHTTVTQRQVDDTTTTLDPYTDGYQQRDLRDYSPYGPTGISFNNSQLLPQGIGGWDH